ncbi:MAG: signal peptidase II [Rickettsiaceae bacterium H1]|nr:signal peptidase II [Rickettsiaceae bacterium H1]
MITQFIFRAKELINKKYLVIYLIIILLIMVIDQWTKNIAKSLVNNNNVFKINEFFNLVSIGNSGVSFGLLNNFPYSNLLFFIINTVIITILFIILLRSKVVTVNVGLALIIGGAIGNLTDRLNFNSVYDFIDLHIGGLHWPAFNFADFMVCFGVIFLFIRELNDKKGN